MMFPLEPAPSTSNPVVVLSEITFRSGALLPPTTFPADADWIAIPVTLAAARRPTSRPTQQPLIVLPSPSLSRMPVAKRVTDRLDTVLDPDLISNPIPAGVLTPWSIQISGCPAKPGWLRPSITTGCVIGGSGDVGVISYGIEPGMLNLIVLWSDEAFAARIAARNESGPESLVFRTTKVVVACAGPAAESPTSNAM